MKINKQDEYGLRILLRMARANTEEGLSIPQLAEMEGMSQPYVAKITRVLRIAGFIQSTRGQKGGYTLALPTDRIILKDVLGALGGRLFEKDFCGSHSGQLRFCTNSVDCSVRSLWKILQFTMDRVLDNITLQDLIGDERTAISALDDLVNSMFILESEENYIK